MPFVHIFCRKSPLTRETIEYIVTGEPEIESPVCRVLEAVFQPYSDTQLALSQTSCSIITCLSAKLPISLIDKSLVSLQILEKLNECGWVFITGEGIHDERGMVFRKKEP